MRVYSLLVVVVIAGVCIASSLPFMKQSFGVDCNSMARSVYQRAGCVPIDYLDGTYFYGEIDCEANGTITQKNSCMGNGTCDECSGEEKYQQTSCSSSIDSMTGVYSCVEEDNPTSGSVVKSIYLDPKCSNDWWKMEVYEPDTCFPEKGFHKATCTKDKVTWSTCLGLSDCSKICTSETFATNTCVNGTMYSCV